MPGAGVHDAGHGQAGVTTPRLPVAHASSESRRTRQGRRTTARTVDTTLIRKLAAAIENAADFYASDSFLATPAIEMRMGPGTLRDPAGRTPCTGPGAGILAESLQVPPCLTIPQVFGIQPAPSSLPRRIRSVVVIFVVSIACRNP